MALDANRALGTLAMLKLRLGISTTDYDAALEAAITTASSLIEQFVGRRLGYSASIEEQVPGHGTSELTVGRAPVWSIASVELDDDVVDATTYECVGDDRYQGVITNRSGWLWTAMLRGEGAQQDPVVGHERRSYTVTYAAGYQLPGQGQVAGVDALPAHIEEACYKAATYFFAQRATDPTITSERLLSYAVSYGGVGATIGSSGLPLSVEAMLGGERWLAQA